MNIPSDYPIIFEPTATYLKSSEKRKLLFKQLNEASTIMEWNKDAQWTLIRCEYRDGIAPRFYFINFKTGEIFPKGGATDLYIDESGAEKKYIFVHFDRATNKATPRLRTEIMLSAKSKVKDVEEVNGRAGFSKDGLKSLNARKDKGLPVAEFFADKKTDKPSIRYDSIDPDENEPTPVLDHTPKEIKVGEVTGILTFGEDKHPNYNVHLDEEETETTSQKFARKKQEKIERRRKELEQAQQSAPKPKPVPKPKDTIEYLTVTVTSGEYKQVTVRKGDEIILEKTYNSNASVDILIKQRVLLICGWELQDGQPVKSAGLWHIYFPNGKKFKETPTYVYISDDELELTVKTKISMETWKTAENLSKHYRGWTKFREIG